MHPDAANAGRNPGIAPADRFAERPTVAQPFAFLPVEPRVARPRRRPVHHRDRPMDAQPFFPHEDPQGLRAPPVAQPDSRLAISQPFGFLHAKPQALRAPPVAQPNPWDDRDAVLHYSPTPRSTFKRPFVVDFILQQLAKANPELATMITERTHEFMQVYGEGAYEKVKVGLTPQQGGGKPVPKRLVPDPAMYQRVTDQLNANPSPELLAGYNSARQTGHTSKADRLVPGTNAGLQTRVETITDRQSAIYAQMGLMKVLRLSEVDLVTLY